MGCMWFVLSDLSDFCDFCVCDELVICVVSLGTGRVPHPASTRKPQPQPAASSGWQKRLFGCHWSASDSHWESEADQWQPKSLFWKDRSRPNLSRKTISWKVFPRAKISSSAVFHFFHTLKASKKLVRTPESQDTSLRSPLQNVACPNTPRKIHPKIPQWMFMLESLFCFLNPFTSFLNLFNVQKVQKKLKSQNWNKLSKTPRASLPHQSQSAWLPTKGSQPGGTSCSAWCLCAQ